LGEVERAVRFSEAALARASGRLRHAYALLALAEATRHQDASGTTRALDRFQKALEAAQAINARSCRAAAELGIAEILIARGEASGARPHLSVAGDICRSLGITRYLPRIAELLNLAENGHDAVAS